MGKFVLRWAWRLTGTAIILSALLVVLSQTETFRSWARHVVLDQINRALLGEVVVDDVSIDIFRGLVLTRPRLYADGKTVLEADEMSLFFDLAPLAGGTLAVNRLSIKRPHIVILRDEADSVWNITRIVRPQADTTDTEPPGLIIAVRRFQINDGAIVVNDRTSPWHDGRTFDPTHLDLKDVQLRASAYLDLRGRHYDVAVDHLECRDRTSPLDIRRFAMAATISRNGVEIPLIRYRTGLGTDLHARASAPGLNVFDTLDLGRHPVTTVLEADNVWGPDLTFYLPSVDVIDTYRLFGSAIYSGNAVRVRDIVLDAGDNRIRGNVDVLHLTDGRPMTLDVSMVNSAATYADMRRRLRFVPLPELDFLRRTTVDSLRMRGTPTDSLWFEVHGEDAPGRFDGELTLHLGKEELGYEVDMQVRRGRLDSFVQDSGMVDSEINGRIMLIGTGTTFPDVDAVAQVELEASRFMGRDVRSLRGLLQTDGMGGIVIDTLTADVTPLQDSTDVLMGLAAEQTVVVMGTLSLASPSRPAYELDIRAKSLDLQRLLKIPTMPTTLTGRFSVIGEGFEPDSLDVIVDADVRQLALDDRAVLPFQLDLNVERQPDMRIIDLVARSQRDAPPFLDARMQGSFTMSSLVDAFGMGVVTAVDVVRERLRHVTDDVVIPAPTPRPLASMDAQLEVVARDLSLINVFLDGVSIDASCIISGRLATGPTSFLIGIDTLRTEGLRIETDSTIIVADPMHVTAELGVANLLATPSLDRLYVQALCDTSLHINDVEIRHPFVSLDLRDSTVRLKATSRINDMEGYIAGRARFTDEATAVDIDSLSYVLDAERSLAWRMIRSSYFTINRGVYLIEDLAVQRAWGETITVAGWLSPSVFRNLGVTVENFPLRDIRTFGELEERDPLALLGGLVTRAEIVVNGTWDEPVIDLDAAATDVSYNGELIGSHRMTLRHSGRTIAGKATIHDPRSQDKVETLVLDIRALPLDLGFTNVAQRWGQDKPIDIRVDAVNLALAAAEPFLPAVERVRGLANGRVTVTGTVPDNIHFDGAARFRNASFIASPTGLQYTADGVLRLVGSDLIFDTLAVRNQPRDLPNGIAYVSGVVQFSGLNVKNIDFKITSPGVHVMNMRSQARSPFVYGDIRIATRGRHLRFYGPLDAPRLDGDMDILYGNVIFPKERSTTKRRLGSFNYIDATDSLGTPQSVMDVAQSRYDRRVKTHAIDTTTAVVDSTSKDFVTQLVERVVEQQAGGFADILAYDLNVYISGRFFLTMVLGSIEILIADLQLDDPKRPLGVGGSLGSGLVLSGKMRVKEGTSSYKFWKPFDASGTLDFSAGGLFNPALKLKAAYRGTRFIPDAQGSPRREDYRVEIDIGGTKVRPTFNFRLFRNDRRIEGDSAQIAADALMMIILGRTKDELFQAGQGNLVNEVGSSLSAVATSALTDMLSGMGGFVNNVQIDLGADLAQTRMQLSGQIFGDVSYRVSGNVADPAANNTFTLTVPLSVLGNADALRYFLLDVSRTINQTGNITRQQREWEIRFGARLP